MAQNNPELDDRLKSFLDDAHREKTAGFTLANLALKVEGLSAHLAVVLPTLDALKATDKRLEGLIGTHDTRLDRHGREIKSLKKQLEYEGEPDTGSYELASIQREVEKQRAERDAERRANQDEVVWWKRQIVSWIVGAIGVIALQILAALITLSAFKK